jgi:ribosomal protein L7/L12
VGLRRRSLDGSRGQESSLCVECTNPASIYCVDHGTFCCAEHAQGHADHTCITESTQVAVDAWYDKQLRTPRAIGSVEFRVFAAIRGAPERAIVRVQGVVFDPADQSQEFQRISRRMAAYGYRYEGLSGGLIAMATFLRTDATGPNWFDVILVAPGRKKIEVIKFVREVRATGLKEAMLHVERAPQPVHTGLPSPHAEWIKRKLEALGATVELRSSNLA